MHVVIQLLTALREYATHHPLVLALAYIGIGYLLGSITYSFFRNRRERWIRRIISAITGTQVTTLELRTWFSSLTVNQPGHQFIRPAMNAQPPGNQKLLDGMPVTLQENEALLEYYFPQHAENMPVMGIRVQRHVEVIFGKPAAYCMPLLLEPVVTPVGGTWYPAIVNTISGFTVLRHLLDRRQKSKYWVHGHRNMFVFDYVAKGEVLGSIDTGVKGEERYIVRAPHAGFVLAFEVQTYTTVVPGTNVLFIGVPQKIEMVTFQGDRAGRFELVGENVSPVGTIQTANTALCAVHSLGFPQEVYMPEDGYILRQYKKAGDPVHYMDENNQYETLFTFIPLTKPLT